MFLLNIHERGGKITNCTRESPMRIMSAGLLSLVFLISVSSATGVAYLNTTLIQPVISDNITELSTNFVFSGDYFSGDYILWDNIGPGGGLYLYSLKDNSTQLIATSSGGMIMPDGYTMSDGTIVWSDDSGILHEYTIAPVESQNIPDANTTGSQKTYSWNGFSGIQRWEPSMYGDQVVWFQGYPEGTYRPADIAFLNTTTDVVTLISESPTGKNGLVINGDNVIWCAYDENVTDAGTHNSLFLHNLVTGKDTVVSSDTGLKGQAALSGNYVGWTDFGDPLATPRPLTQVHIYTISSGTAQTVPATTMNQDLDFITGDYAVYSECPAYNEADKATGEEPCQAKIFDILTGSIWQLPQSHNDQTILGYSNGLFLVEDTRDEAPELSLVRAENLPPAETITATPNPGMSEKNVTSMDNSTTPSVPPTQTSPGFEFPVMIIALVIIGGVAGKLAAPS
ncbi:MAG: hypothetical protein WB284_08100 [Methanoregula sp.]